MSSPHWKHGPCARNREIKNEEQWNKSNTPKKQHIKETIKN